MQKFKSAIIAFGLMAIALTAFTLVPATGMAQLISPDDVPGAITAQTGGEGDIKEFAKTILNFLLGFLGFICVVFIIYAGFLLVTSSGNEDNVGKAKKILMYAIAGIILILASFAIVNTALKAPSGSAGSTTVVTQ